MISPSTEMEEVQPYRVVRFPQREHVTDMDQYLLQKFKCLGRIQLILGILCLVMSVFSTIFAYEQRIENGLIYFEDFALKPVVSILFIGSVLFISTGCLTFCMQKPEQGGWMYLKLGFVICSSLNAGLFGPAVFFGGAFYAFWVFIYLPSYGVVPLFLAFFALAETIVASASAIYCNSCMCGTQRHPI